LDKISDTNELKAVFPAEDHGNNIVLRGMGCSGWRWLQ